MRFLKSDQMAAKQQIMLFATVSLLSILCN